MTSKKSALNLHFSRLELLLLESVLEGHEDGSLLSVDLLVVQDTDHSSRIHRLS